MKSIKVFIAAILLFTCQHQSFTQEQHIHKENGAYSEQELIEINQKFDSAWGVWRENAFS